MKRRLIRIFFALVLVVGIGVLLYPLITNVAYQLGAYNVISSYDASLKNYSEEELAQMWEDAYAYNAELGHPTIRDPFAYTEVVSPLERYYDILNPDGTGVMGYVEIPSIGVSLPIYHGTSDETLENGSGHIATTALPIDGVSIHPVITGHTGLPNKMLFTNLNLVKIDDVFIVKILEKTFRYKVVSIDIIEPDDTALLQPIEGQDRMTLLTCTPYGINSHRLLVTGVPTTDEVPEQVGISAEAPWWLLLILLLLVVMFIVMAALRHKARRANPKRSVMGYNIALVVLGIAIIVLAWIIVGIAMRISLIPYVDLGYSAFDAHVFTLFGF